MSQPRTAQRVAVIGLGVIGSMTLWSLARRGIDAVGYESYGIGHDFAASGGETRQMRILYGEGPQYLPLLERARSLWLELSRQSGRVLFDECGALTIGPTAHPWVASVIAMASRSGLPHEILTAPEARGRYPRFRLESEDTVVVDPGGGLLRTHQAVLSAVQRAEACGALVRTGCPVAAVEPRPHHVAVRAADGDREFDQVVVATGAAAAELCPAAPVAQVRIRQSYHLVTGSQLPMTHFPPVMRYDQQQQLYASQPMPDPQWVKFFGRDVSDADIYQYAAIAQRTVERELRGVWPVASRIGVYADGYTPDGHPVIGRRADDDRIVIAAGMSGHGFKLAPAFGELTADIVEGRHRAEAGLFDPARLAPLG